MKERIDVLLVERRLVESRSKARWLIKNGYILINGKKVLKPGKRIDSSLKIILEKNFPYVGRGGIKLEAALRDFSISVKEKVCVDIGASVGGFTDCLIKHGALKVYSIDTATDQLHPSLTDKTMKNKIVPLLGLDARDLIKIEEKVDICTIDVTFTSIKAILPNVKKILLNKGDIIALVKPLFETPFQNENRFKIIQDSKKLCQILLSLIQWNLENQLFPYGIIKSPILGKEGSIEFFIHLRLDKFHSKFNYEDILRELLF
jgi:23S rRNA (cytidine1920-2'-O)/16S rRNA (cytidine1409-2'-O)-methyltransferase